MQISIAYPPINSSKGTPLLSQNRQFQYFNSPTYVYPVVLASAATLLKEKGFEVSWNDGIASEQTYAEFIEEIDRTRPDLMAIESKTPVIKKSWQHVNDLKERFPAMKIALMGDHVSALPEESFANCAVDFVIKGGDYDWQLLALAKHLDAGDALDPGVYYRVEGKVKKSDGNMVWGNLDDLPMIDRELTKWRMYAYRNGNFRYLPGAYTMVSRDCWWRRAAGEGRQGGCTFCSWTSIFPTWRTQSVGRLLDEIGHLISLGVREVFDDAGTFPVGAWLEEFCVGMIKRGFNKKISFSCNMRAGALTREQYQLMGKANFRFLLYGLESASEETLTRINKGITTKQMEETFKWASEAGCQPHATCMVGYPWESYADAKATVDFTNQLFRQGYIKTLQATVVIPYPGTELFRQCEANGWLLTRDWNDYDMRRPVMKSALTDEQALALTRSIYRSALTPEFILREVMSVRNWDDIKYYSRTGRKFIGHLLDFGAEKDRSLI